MTHRVRIKVCGITSVTDAQAAADAGADAVGFVFCSSSPRQVSPVVARAIARALPPFVLRVGVFVDASSEQLHQTSEEVGLDLLQLHGAEAPEIFSLLPRRGIKAVAVGADFDPEEALRYTGHADGVLLDTRVDGEIGGTGRTFDWELARQVRGGLSWLGLAGGLTPDNVAAGIAAVAPDAVDVTSGVEAAPGRKDPRLLRAFVAAVRRAEG